MPHTATRGSHGPLNLREIPTSSRDKAKASDFAGKNKSFPILEPKDVAAAAKAIGRAGSDNYSSDQLKANIIRIAKRKGATFVAQLPKAWREGDKTASKDAAFAPFVSLVSLAAAEDGKPRASWAQLARTGDFYDPRYGDFTIGRKDLASMAENFKTGRYPQNPTELAFDYNHGTGRPASDEQGKASGWLKDLELRANGDELWGLVEWTDRAAELIESKEYRFVSATFSFEYTNSNGGDPIGPTLLAAALTNRPVIHGMEPVSLALADPGAMRLADAGGDDEAEEMLFSYDEQRRRVQAALTAAYGTAFGYPDGCYSPCRGVYLEALYDGAAIYCEADGSKFQVSYAIGADGAVTFTSEPVEVRVTYEPLTAPDAEETTMSTIKVKDAKGNDIELSQEGIDAIVKAHAPKPDGSVELAAMKQTLDTQNTRIDDLQKKNEALELAAKQRTAEAEFDTLLKAGKVDPKQKDTLVKLAMSNHEMFVELTGAMPVIRQIDTVTGTVADAGTVKKGESAELTLAIDEELKANPKQSREQAYAAALDKNPALYKG